MSYTTDSDYKAGKNACVSYAIQNNGVFTGKANNVTGMVSIGNGGTGANKWLTARQNLGVYSSTSAPSNQAASWADTVWVQY